MRYMHPNCSQIACCWVFFSCLSLPCITRGPLQLDYDDLCLLVDRIVTTSITGRSNDMQTILWTQSLSSFCCWTFCHTATVMSSFCCWTFCHTATVMSSFCCWTFCHTATVMSSFCCWTFCHTATVMSSFCCWTFSHTATVMSRERQPT